LEQPRHAYARIAHHTNSIASCEVEGAGSGKERKKKSILLIRASPYELRGLMLFRKYRLVRVCDSGTACRYGYGKARCDSAATYVDPVHLGYRLRHLAARLS
jgi:hypothetical protein